MDFELPRLRRFALIIGSILFLFCLAGVKFPPEPKLTIFGLQLTIVRRDFVDWGLVLASVYASVHYLYVAWLKLIPPWAVRKNLFDKEYGVALKGEAPNVFVRRYHPGAPPDVYMFPTKNKGDGLVRIYLPASEVTKRMWILSKIDDLDYLLPVIVNTAGLLYLFWSWGARHV